ncbi:MAG: hypothetical protein AB7S26_22895 [Sandaracinaceae bacterium]
MRTRHPVALAALLMVACGGEEDPGQPTETPEAVTPEEVATPGEETSGEPSTEPTTATAEAPSYSIHEWGLLDVDLGENQVEYAAGPGTSSGSTATASNDHTTHSGRTGRDDVDQATDEAVDVANDLFNAVDHATGGQLPVRPTVGRRKPVLYFHLTDPATPVTIRLSVNLGTGRMLEHFPGAQLTDHGVTWNDVRIGGSSCEGGPYPTSDGPACSNVADHYCEAAELAHYSSSDAGCLTFGGLEHNFLFYRGDGPAPTLPVTITRADDGTVRIQNDGIAEPVGPLLRLRRVGDAIQVSQVAMPARGSSVSLARPSEAASDTHRDIVRDQLEEIGLTGGESQAFETAWFGELFDGAASTPHAFSDAVLYFLPEESVDGFAHLEATPPPAGTVRAMAVRAGWR